jgi:5-methylthioribose kinase
MSQTTFTKVKSFAESIEYDTFAEKTRADLDAYCKIINDLELCNKEHVEKAKQYVLKRLEPLFSSEKIVFVHDDVHMGNVIVSKDGRATLIDFDEAGSGPLVFMFTTMFGFLDNPSQYTDGTPQQADFEHVQFHHLFPIWYHEFASVFNVIHRRERLILQLNLLYIVEGLQTISENWSPVLNDNLMKSILEHELYEQEVDIVLKSYYGKLVHRLLNSL